MSAIWLPGQGMVDLSVTRVDKAVQEYDERLRFGRNEATGQYCIFRRMDHGDPLAKYQTAIGPVLPILAFDKVPHPEDALKRLYQTDAMRRGNEILDEINKGNEAIEAAGEAKAQEADGIAAEVMDFAHRLTGTAPHLKVFPGEKRGEKMGGWL